MPLGDRTTPRQVKEGQVYVLGKILSKGKEETQLEEEWNKHIWSGGIPVDDKNNHVFTKEENKTLMDTPEKGFEEGNLDKTKVDRRIMNVQKEGTR